MPGTHRAAFHNVWVVLIPGALLLWDVKFREESYVLNRWGAYGYRVAWVTLVAVLFAHILLDAFFNGVNLFWPVHDRFYDLSGKLMYTNQRGLVQTFVEFDSSTGGVAESTTRGRPRRCTTRLGSIRRGTNRLKTSSGSSRSRDGRAVRPHGCRLWDRTLRIAEDLRSEE